MDKFVTFENLKNVSLKPRYIYKGGKQGNISDDPFNALLNVGNAAGMRPKKNINGNLAYIVLITNPSNHEEYPDKLNKDLNILTYFGDQRIPERDYLDTKQKGNFNIEKLFHEVFSKNCNNANLFPCFYFEKNGDTGRDYTFHGIVYPLTKNQKLNEVCEKVIIPSDKGIIENLKFLFALDTASEISRDWLTDLLLDNKNSSNAPASWKEFIQNLNSK